MNLYYLKSKSHFLYKILLPLTLLCPLFFFDASFSEINEKETINIIKNKVSKRNPSNYILGKGDILYIAFEGLNLFSNKYKINNDGYLALPEIGYFYAENQLLSEIELKLEKEYEEFIIDPKLEVALLTPRDVTVSLIGEVNRPGLYKFITSTKTEVLNANFPSQDISFKFPKLFDVLKKGNGITNNADLNKIKVIRNNPIAMGGGKIKAEVSIIELLETGDQTQNLEIYDGDVIIVLKSNMVSKEQILRANKSNLSPSSVNVFINGTVENKGLISLRQGTSLFEGIAAAGGKQYHSGNVRFIRLNMDGKTEKRLIPFNENAAKGSKNNPILMEGDIVFIEKTLLGKTTAGIKEYSAPILSSYGLYKIFN